jgi:16S rRNA (guanine966-N2)-methyltransferase
MRVIAGKFRGRTLRAPKGLNTRPTMDRAREAIFSILGNLTDLKVVDFFAGTGAMGIEALSRGAAHATFVESDHAAAQVIRDNLKALGIEKNATVLEMPGERSRARLEKLGPFDLVMADPPWRMAQEAATSVATWVRGLLAPDARVLLGHASETPVELPEGSGLALADRRRWGGSGMSFFEIESDSEDL